METIFRDTEQFYDLYDLYSEQVNILVYPAENDPHDSCTKPEGFGTTIDGVEVGFYAGTGIGGVVPNAKWVGPHATAEDAMIEYEELYPFEDWASERGYRIED